jgi:hypothetical protein
MKLPARQSRMRGWEKRLANLLQGKRIKQDSHAGRGQQTKREIPDDSVARKEFGSGFYVPSKA